MLIFQPFGLRFRAGVFKGCPAKSGTSPLRPPTGQDFAKAYVLKWRRKLEGPDGETGFPASTDLFDFPNLLLQITYTNSFIIM